MAIQRSLATTERFSKNEGSKTETIDILLFPLRFCHNTQKEKKKRERERRIKKGIEGVSVFVVVLGH